MVKKHSVKASLLPPACPHHTRDNLGMLQWYDDREQREAAGERQTQCPDCHLWLYPHEMGVKPAVNAKHG